MNVTLKMAKAKQAQVDKYVVLKGKTKGIQGIGSKRRKRYST